MSSTGHGPGESSRQHAATFKQLADAIDDAFARWDRSHLPEFTLTGQTRLCHPDPDWEIEGELTEDYQRVKLSRLRPGEQFVYVFDLGDGWAHLCTIGAQRVDPVEVLGILPDKPLPYWGRGDIPDQYRRRWDGDDGESPQPVDPGLADLPPFRPHWGPPARWRAIRSRAGAPDVYGRGMVEQVFHRVPVEPGDRAQPAGDRCPGPAFGFQVAGVALDVSAAGLEQADVALVAPGGVLPQVQRVGLAGQARVADQEPSQRQPLSAREHRLGDGGNGRRGCGHGGHEAPPGSC